MDIFSISEQAASSTVAHCMLEGQPLVCNTVQCCPSGSRPSEVKPEETWLPQLSQEELHMPAWIFHMVVSPWQNKKKNYPFFYLV